MLLCGLILCHGHLAIKTSWLSLLGDHSGPGVIELSNIQFLNEVPVTPGSIDEILTGKNPTAPTIHIKVANRWHEGLYKTTEFDFATQLEKHSELPDSIHHHFMLVKII